MNRREFLGKTAGLTATLIARGIAGERQPATGADSRIDVLLDEPGAIIAPEIYGHFTENLGGVIYDGVWVGEDSKIANVNGIRKDLVEALRRVKPGMIRWPGGCFADQYDWRDGIGPRDKRPKRTNFWVDASEWPKGANRKGPQFYDPNAFGTVEFARFCELVGAQPYFAANLRSLPAKDLYSWVEYCNAPNGTTALAAERGADGHPEPLQVRYWGIGNESWGCGGNFDPEDYAGEYRRYTAWVPSYGVPLALVGSGPSDDSYSWTRRCFNKLARDGEVRGMWGWSMHHYSWNATGHPSHDWYGAKGDALKFDAEQYYSILREAELTEELIRRHWDVMSESDPQHRVKLVVDEWGAWYAPGTEPFPEALLGQQSTMRDAVIAGLTLNIFNCHAEKVGMASVAQLVNNLQALFLAHQDRLCVTPTYHVFDLYAAHQGAKSIRTVISAPGAHYTWSGQPASLQGLSSSASLRDRQLTVTVVNPSIDTARETELTIRGGKIRDVRAKVLGESDVHAHNSFENPRSVEPKEQNVAAQGSSLTHEFPPASVTKLEVALG